MIRLALSLSVLLLAAMPARADFFDDLGDALGKAADSVGNAANDVGSAVGDVFDSSDKQEEQNKPQQQARQQPQPQTTIRWNQPERVTSQQKPRSDTGFFSVTDEPAPNTLRPTAGPRRSSSSLIVDDAPPPRAAPPRRPVNMVASLTPLPGFAQAPEPHFRPSYAPSYAAASLPLPRRMETPPPPVPTAKPAAVVDRSFTLRFENRFNQIPDNVTRTENARPTAPTRALLQSVAEQLKTPGQRLALKAESAVMEGRISEARQRSFARAKLVQKWLEDMGVRSTQIDLKVEVASADTVSLDVYRAD
jgi:hypothetical protein